MQDKIIAAIAAYLEKEIRPQFSGRTEYGSYEFNSRGATSRDLMPKFCKEIATEIAAAIAPLVNKNEEYLEQINTEMWQTWGVKDAQFGREEGDKIMTILNEWAGGVKPVQKADKCREAIEYYFSVLDEVRGVEWRKTPDHVTRKMIEAIDGLKQ